MNEDYQVTKSDGSPLNGHLSLVVSVSANSFTIDSSSLSSIPTTPTPVKIIASGALNGKTWSVEVDITMDLRPDPAIFG
jgi:hypothetical protein